MRIKNDFQLICNNLNQCKKECYCNPIVCSRAFLRSYVKNDLDLLMKIKVEAEEYDNGNIFKNNQISILMCFIATSSLVLNMEKEMGNTVLVVVEIQVFLAVLVFLMILASEKLDKIQRWRKYILVAIDEIEKEIRENAEGETFGFTGISYSKKSHNISHEIS